MVIRDAVNHEAELAITLPTDINPTPPSTSGKYDRDSSQEETHPGPQRTITEASSDEDDDRPPAKISKVTRDCEHCDSYQEIQCLKKQLKRARQKMNKLQLNTDPDHQLQQTVLAKESELSAAENQISTMTTVLQHHQDTVATLEEELTSSKQSLSSTSATIETLNQQLKQVSEELLSTQADSSRQKEMIEELRETLNQVVSPLPPVLPQETTDPEDNQMDTGIVPLMSIKLPAETVTEFQQHLQAKQQAARWSWRYRIAKQILRYLHL